MQKRTAGFLLPFSAYVGSMLGVGIYGLPYVLKQSGLLLFFVHLVIVTSLVLVLYFMFADVAFGTSNRERFLGYIKEYCGRRLQQLFLWVHVISGWGAGLSLMLVWGVFAHELLLPLIDIPALVFSTFFFIVTFPIIYRGKRSVEGVDLFVLCAVLVLFVVLWLVGKDHVGLLPMNPETTFGYILPYGTLMFAFWGAGIIPEVVNQLRSRPAVLKQLLAVGVLSIAVVYALFAVYVVSISGSDTSQEAIAGLEPYIGRSGIVIGSLIGMSTIWLSYSNAGWVSRNIFIHDFHLSRIRAMLVTLFPPLVLLLLGIHNFILIMSIVGAVGIGLQGIIIARMYYKSHTKAFRRPFLFARLPKAVTYTGAALLVLGVCIELLLLLYKYI